MFDKDFCSALSKEIFIRVRAAETDEQLKAANDFIFNSIEENWDDAHQEGYDEGYSEGYDVGRNEGYNAGYDKGYDDAIEEAGENEDV